MIIKYQNGQTWGFIDKLSNVTHQDVDAYERIMIYRDLVKAGNREEHSENLPTQTVMFNDLFMSVSEQIAEELEGYSYTMKPLIDECGLPTMDDGGMPTEVIVCNNENRDEFDKVVLLTNQKCYLLNDQGQTIERLN